MKLINLKNAGDVDYATPGTPPNYSGSLCLYLDKDQCVALGLTSALKPGTQVTIRASAIVTTSSASLDRDGDDAGPDVSLSMQITDMGVETGTVLRNAAQMLYGGE